MSLNLIYFLFIHLHQLPEGMQTSLNINRDDNNNNSSGGRVEGQMSHYVTLNNASPPVGELKHASVQTLFASFLIIIFVCFVGFTFVGIYKKLNCFDELDDNRKYQRQKIKGTW